MVCLDAKRGKIVWQQDLPRVAKVKRPRWGFASSALVMGDAVIYNAGEYGVAFHRSSGKVLWKSTGLGAYATAIPYPAGSVPKSGTNGGVILFSAQGAVAVQYRGSSAKVLWRLPLTNKYQVNAAVPIYVNDGLYLSTGYGVGGLFASLKGSKPQKQWQNKNLRIHFPAPMAKDGYIYGVDGQAGRGKLVCLDARTGQLKWKANDTRFGTFITVGDKIIYLNDTGELFVIAANPQRYEKLISWKTPLGRTCWTRPIYANGMLYCRNDKGKLIAIDLH
ncbi:MAG: hypothetical protein D6820_06570 [Lentisphaerae bacterium]|nr:MAG: hypothetical protein D6820_06570 [Lentisphaerota bacterium]